MTFSEFSDYVTVASGFMTIFGLGGLFSWGIFRRNRSGVSAAVFQIFAYSIKTGMCVLLIFPFLFLWHLLYGNLLSFILGGFAYRDYYWQSEDQVKYIFVYLTTLIILLPLYFVSCLSVYQWSVAPFITFYKTLRYRHEDTAAGIRG